MTKPHLQIALALIWRGDEILVTKRRADADHLANFWEFPGGKVKTEESHECCAVREALEEVGIEIEIVHHRDIIAWDYPERLVSLHPFDCRLLRGEPQAIEVADWKWVQPIDLKVEEFPPANAELIRDLIADKVK
jgi:mutator protein MutT